MTYWPCFVTMCFSTNLRAENNLLHSLHRNLPSSSFLTYGEHKLNKVLFQASREIAATVENVSSHSRNVEASWKNSLFSQFGSEISQVQLCVVVQEGHFFVESFRKPDIGSWNGTSIRVSDELQVDQRRAE